MLLSSANSRPQVYVKLESILFLSKKKVQYLIMCALFGLRLCSLVVTIIAVYM